MKKFFLILTMIVLIVPMFCYAEPAEDKDAIIAQLNERISELEEQLQALLQTEDSQSMPTQEPSEPEYGTLKKGSKGDDVVKLQERLKELKYLSGKSDGSYGSGTENAIRAFQVAAGLTETGIADEETQTVLFGNDAPESPNPVVDESLYEKLDYKANSRDPDSYEGTKIRFSGKIVQVMEDSGVAVFRIATKGHYDDVVYCMYLIPENYKRFLEDDKVTVYGESMGIYSYTTVMGGTVTIPACYIERIELN